MTNMRRRWHLPILLLLFSIFGLWVWLDLLAYSGATVSGIVLDGEGPVAGARVRARATGNQSSELNWGAGWWAAPAISYSR